MNATVAIRTSVQRLIGASRTVLPRQMRRRQGLDLIVTRVGRPVDLENALGGRNDDPPFDIPCNPYSAAALRPETSGSPWGGVWV